MMPYGAAVIYKAKESCLLIDDPYRHATYTPCFLSHPNSILHPGELHTSPSLIRILTGYNSKVWLFDVKTLLQR